MNRASVYTHLYLLRNFTWRSLIFKGEQRNGDERGGGETLRGMSFRMGDARTCLHGDKNNLKERVKWVTQKKGNLKE